MDQAKGLHQKKRTGKPQVTKKPEAMKVMCNFCDKKGHVEDVCWKKKKVDKLNKKLLKTTTEIRVMEVPEGDIMQKVDFALAELYNDLIGCLPTKVSESEFLFPLTTNTTKSWIINNTTVSDLTTEITVLVKNQISNEVNKTLESNFNIRKSTPLNRVLIDTGASWTIVSWHAIPAELFKNWKAAK